MKKTYFKYLFSSFKNDLTRILAIFLIVFLGVGFVVGLRSSSPDLKRSANQYYIDSKFNDMYILSTIGFSKTDEKTFKDTIDGAKYVQAEYLNDSYFTIDGKIIEGRENIRPMDDNSINKLSLYEGRFPESKDECVALIFSSTSNLIKIGSSIYINNEEKKVVGFVNDPFYLCSNGDATNVGDGNLDVVTYFDEKFFPDMNYSVLRIVYHDSYRLNSFSSDYSKYINEKINLVSQGKQQMISKRLEDIKSTIRDEATKAVKENIIQSLEDIGVSTEEIANIIDGILASEAVQNQINAEVDNIFNEQFGNVDVKWYVLTRDEIQGARMFKEDSAKVGLVADVFPIFFYLIALLVSMASMTRIISKDRQNMGTLKSLGYKKGLILLKYVIFGGSATLLGAIFGSILGNYGLTWVISYFYLMLYNLPSVTLYANVGIFSFYSFLMLAMVLLISIILSLETLKENTSNLLTGKAPIAGKKILLEKIPFLWNHLSFKLKSSFRNIFRFKKNLIMVILGIGGCTGLLLTGFGLSDSMSVVSDEKNGEIIKYDFVARVNEEDETLFEGYDNSFIYYLDGDVYTKNENIPISLISGNDIKKFINLDKPSEFNENSIVITDQIASILDVTVGEKIVFCLDAYEESFQVAITGITKNYLNNYIYFGENALNTYFPKAKKNAYIVRTGLNGDELSNYMNSLKMNEKIISISSFSQTRDSYIMILKNLDAMILLIVFFSGALIAVVIYNLTDIIISERVKDIATLRVNGYHRLEAYNFISRELFIMSFIGLIIGIFFGIWLHNYAMSLLSSIGLNFSLTIEPLSYVYTILLASFFIIFSILIFYPKVRRIHMAEALKSSE